MLRRPRSRYSVWLYSWLVLTMHAGAIALASAPRLLTAQVTVSMATTQVAARRQGVVVIGKIAWDCRLTNCRTANMPVDAAARLAACQGLAREVGVLTGVTVANRVLTSAELVQCNGAPTAAIPAPTAPAPRTYPVRIPTQELTVTGIGRLSDRLPFTAKSARTEELTVTGTGRLAERLPFTPKTITTLELTVTGTGVIR